MTETTSPSTDEPTAAERGITATEMLESLGGFDEIAIAQRFGDDITALPRTTFGRSLIFVDLRRRGTSDSAAFKAAMALKLGEVNAYFKADEPPAEDDEAGDDESGKDE